MLINQDDNTEQSVGAELYLTRLVSAGIARTKEGYLMTALKWEGRKVLIPTRESQRREIAEGASEIVTGLHQTHINPDAPLRYDPTYRKRRAATPEFFYSGRGNKTLKTARKSWVDKHIPK